MIFLAVLKVHSDTLLGAQMHRNFLAIMRKLETSANYPSAKEEDWVPLQFMINLVFWAQTIIFIPEAMASFGLLLSNSQDNFLLLASGSFDFNSILWLWLQQDINFIFI